MTLLKGCEEKTGPRTGPQEHQNTESREEGAAIAN